jgi:hypothetical protein
MGLVVVGVLSQHSLDARACFFKVPSIEQQRSPIRDDYRIVGVESVSALKVHARLVKPTQVAQTKPDVRKRGNALRIHVKRSLITRQRLLELILATQKIAQSVVRARMIGIGCERSIKKHLGRRQFIALRECGCGGDQFVGVARWVGELRLLEWLEEGAH